MTRVATAASGTTAIWLRIDVTPRGVPRAKVPTVQIGQPAATFLSSI